MVTHPPRVDPGLYLGTTAGLALPNDSALALAMTPQLSPYVRYGVRDSSGWGVSGAAALSMGARGGVQGDLYVQLPARAAGWSHGAGLVMAANYLMPYVQAGRQSESGSGWYLTGAYAHRGWQQDEVLLAPTRRVRPRYWSTTLTGRRERHAGAMELYASGAVGHYDRELPDNEAGDTTVERRRLWSLSFGVAFESNLDRILGGYRPPPARRPPTPTPPPVPRP